MPAISGSTSVYISVADDGGGDLCLRYINELGVDVWLCALGAKVTTNITILVLRFGNNSAAWCTAESLAVTTVAVEPAMMRTPIVPMRLFGSETKASFPAQVNEMKIFNSATTDAEMGVLANDMKIKWTTAWPSRVDWDVSQAEVLWVDSAGTIPTLWEGQSVRRWDCQDFMFANLLSFRIRDYAEPTPKLQRDSSQALRIDFPDPNGVMWYPMFGLNYAVTPRNLLANTTWALVYSTTLYGANATPRSSWRTLSPCVRRGASSSNPQCGSDPVPTMNSCSCTPSVATIPWP